jgi:hypothetical protein
LTYSFGIIKWSKTNLQNINIQTRVLFTKFCKHHPKSAIERFNLPRENGGKGFSNLEILQHNQIASLKNYFLNRARDNTFLHSFKLRSDGQLQVQCFSQKWHRYNRKPRKMEFGKNK